jgi:membrane fusion protein, multidrug efflux system
MLQPNNWIFAICVLLLFSSCKEKNGQAANAAPAARRNAPLAVEGFIVKTKTLSENIEVPGSLLPYETTEIRPEISGRIIQLNVAEGRNVSKGTLLVKLFDGDLQAQLKKLQVQLTIAQKTAERQKQLLTINGISQQEYDLSELEVSNLNADIELTKVAISKTEIRAPFNGQVGLRNISLGAYVSPETIITTISQVNDLKLEFTVPEKYSENMRTGKMVSFFVDGIKNNFKARVIATESSIESNTRSMRVRGVVQGNSSGLVSGAFAKVSLEMGKDEDALIIPTQAVIPQARNKKVVVYRGGATEFATVTTGIRDSSYVQILDGLKAGDTVVTTGLLAIRPESKITLTKVQ